MSKHLDGIYCQTKRISEFASETKRRIKFILSALHSLTVYSIIAVTFLIGLPWLKFSILTILAKNSPNQLQTETEPIKSQNLVSEVKAKPTSGTFYLKSEQVEISGPIVEGAEKEALKKGIGHHPETPWPDRPGNVILAGHSFDLDLNNPYRKVFFELNKAKIGDQISIFYDSKVYLYRIFNIKTVKPNNNEFFRQDYSRYLLTVYTCVPVYTNLNRLIVQAELEKILPQPIVPNRDRS